MKFFEKLLQALLFSAPRGFAARARVLVRLVSLAQIGELARRLDILSVTDITETSFQCSVLGAWEDL